MMLRLRITAAIIPSLLVLGISGFASLSSHRLSPSIIVTAAPAFEPLAALKGRERFPEGAQLLLAHDGQAAPLMEGFAESADASISFDGPTLLFAGKQSPRDAWSIWEFKFADHSARKVIAGNAELIRPLYLPGDRLVYSRLTTHGFQMESAKLDGTDVLPLTYMAASAVPETVLADGRILFQAGFPLGTSIDKGAIPELFLVYGDGSGVESYRCDHGAPRWGGTQLTSGDVVFTHGPRMARFTSPLATEAPVAAPKADYAGAVAEAESGEWLVSARAVGETHFGLKLWKPGRAAFGTLLSRRGEDLVQPVILASRPRPNRHPTALHKWDYANLLALDARVSREDLMKVQPAAIRLESLGADGKRIDLGTAPVETDGSFFIKVPGDAPIRFSLLDKKGATLRAEHGWFWIRKGEQRYCVGCHAGPEHAPENRVPQVLLHNTAPVDLAGASDNASRGGR